MVMELPQNLLPNNFVIVLICAYPCPRLHKSIIYLPTYVAFVSNLCRYHSSRVDTCISLNAVTYYFNPNGIAITFLVNILKTLLLRRLLMSCLLLAADICNVTCQGTHTGSYITTKYLTELNIGQ